MLCALIYGTFFKSHIKFHEGKFPCKHWGNDLPGHVQSKTVLMNLILPPVLICRLNLYLKGNGLGSHPRIHNHSKNEGTVTSYYHLTLYKIIIFFSGKMLLLDLVEK